MKNTTKFPVVSEVIGWVGVSMIVLAYLLVSANILGAQSWLFQGLNLVGAAGVAWVSYEKHIMQTLVLNLFWGAIALVALVGIFLAL